MHLVPQRRPRRPSPPSHRLIRCARRPKLPSRRWPYPRPLAGYPSPFPPSSLLRRPLPPQSNLSISLLSPAPTQSSSVSRTCAASSSLLYICTDILYSPEVWEHLVRSLSTFKSFQLTNPYLSYANSVLQALYFCAPFRDLVIQSADTSTPSNGSLVTQPALPSTTNTLGAANGSAATTTTRPTSLGLNIPTSPPTLFSALRSLFFFISSNPLDKGSVAPRAFIDKLKEVNEAFRNTQHQDAHEFLNYLLNRIVEEVGVDEHHKDKDKENEGEDREFPSFSMTASRTLTPMPMPFPSQVSASIATISTGPATVRSASSQDDTTIVHRLFEGVLTSETRCLTCETVRLHYSSYNNSIRGVARPKLVWGTLLFPPCSLYLRTPAYCCSRSETTSRGFSFFVLGIWSWLSAAEPFNLLHDHSALLTFSAV